MTPKIYILLPVHNRKEITQHFIRCLEDQTIKDYHLVLIDDGSTDGTAEMVLERIPGATVLRGTGQWWWAGSLQQGLDWLNKNIRKKNALILFINDDVSFEPDYLEHAIALMQNKQGSMVLSQVIDDNGVVKESGVHADLQRLTFNVAQSAKEINCLSTRGLFIHWQDVLSIGGFYPTLLPHYLSDYEYTLRGHRKGFKCESNPLLVIKPNFDSTGYHSAIDSSFFAFLKTYFSKKSAINPIYLTVFIFLVAPFVRIPSHLARTWIAAFRVVQKAMFRSGKSCHHQ